MEQQEKKPAPMDLLRAVVPSWFILAGLAGAFTLKLAGTQMAAAVIFGGFLCDLTYALFFDQTLAVLLKNPAPNIRYMMLASAAILLLVSLFLWTR